MVLSLYSMDDVKKYDKTSDLFRDLPKEITRVLLNDFSELLSEDFTTITRYDPMTVPNGMPVTVQAKGRTWPKGLNETEQDEEQYIKELNKELYRKDIQDLNNDQELKDKLPQMEKGSDSEEESSADEETWEKRLRKRVTFSDKNKR